MSYKDYYNRAEIVLTEINKVLKSKLESPLRGEVIDSAAVQKLLDSNYRVMKVDKESRDILDKNFDVKEVR